MFETISEIKASVTVRLADERGLADHGWLKSRHSFSFAEYFDPKHVQFGALRVINEDRIAPGTGFGTHGHRDMEIISYVLEGELAHKDSMGNGSVIRPGDVQRMSAGRGVFHSEFNNSKVAPTHFLQIWITPNVTGIDPGYEERHFSTEAKRGRLCLIASPDASEGSVGIHQDARLYAGVFEGGQGLRHALDPLRRAYLHVVRGSIVAQGEQLFAGDALLVEHADELTLGEGKESEVLLFDLA